MGPRLPRFWMIACHLLVLCSVLSGCSGQRPEPQTSQPTVARQKIRIAVIPKGTTEDYWKSIHAGAVEAAKELGDVEIVWKGPAIEGDKVDQIRIVESFIVGRIDGICLVPIDRDALVPVVRRAKERGIPTVVVDSGLSDEQSFVSYVATDNYHGGVIAAKYLAELLNGKGG